MQSWLWLPIRRASERGKAAGPRLGVLPPVPARSAALAAPRQDDDAEGEKRHERHQPPPDVVPPPFCSPNPCCLRG